MLSSVFIIPGLIIFFLMLQTFVIILIIRRENVKKINDDIKNIKECLGELQSKIESNIKKSESNINNANEIEVNSNDLLTKPECSAKKENPDSEEHKPFDFVKCFDPADLLNFIQDDHPQTIALILSYLKPAHASLILQNLPEELQSDVIRRIACMDRVNPKIVAAVERVLGKHLVSCANFPYSGGIESAVNILSAVDRASEKKIIQTLEDIDPELAQELKKWIFVFEDIVKLDDRAVQKIMREVDSQGLAKALKNASTEAHNKIFKNMSERAAAMLREEIEYMGPVRLCDVKSAQEKIVSIIRHLEDTGEIVVARADDELLV